MSWDGNTRVQVQKSKEDKLSFSFLVINLLCNYELIYRYLLSFGTLCGVMVNKLDWQTITSE